ncbi:heavy-metal-associated domain-containing protein [Natrialbaceae archaeon A-gly3]
MEETALEVDGMACGGCEENVKDALEALAGVSSVSADHEQDRVRVEHDASTVDVDAIADAIESAGYNVSA